ncbi:MAG: hypothetical protein QXD11_02315 [Candidatus Micrarchaeaceae archaeon]
MNKIQNFILPINMSFSGQRQFKVAYLFVTMNVSIPTGDWNSTCFVTIQRNSFYRSTNSEVHTFLFIMRPNILMIAISPTFIYRSPCRVIR